MKGNSHPARLLVSAFSAVAFFWLAGNTHEAVKEVQLHYKVLPATLEDNLAVFPVITATSFDTRRFLTLDEGVRSGEVIVTEAGQNTGLVRPRPRNDQIWPERPLPVPETGARVNQLALINRSDRPLILLAGEIVTGGKQDRIVGKDRIIPAHSEPVALDVFCVEPHRWTATSTEFGALGSAMAQPSVRSKAMADRNQQEVWNEVAKSRTAFAAAVPFPEARALESTSSYAVTMQNDGVKRQLDSLAAPIQHSYEKLSQQLRAEKAVGAVVAVNGEIIWADVFASPSLLEKYWPKLVRSYAAEALGPRTIPGSVKVPPSQGSAQNFLDHFDGNHETVETEPGVYRATEIASADFEAFLLTSLLPNTGFNVHIAKMKH